MDPTVFKLINSKKYDEAVNNVKQFLENVSFPVDSATTDAITRAIQVIVIKLIDAEQLDSTDQILTKYLEIRNIGEPLRTRHLNQLGLGEGIKRTLYRMNYEFASKIIERFNFIEDQSVFNFFFSELVQNGEYTLALKWIKLKNDPNFYTNEKLITYLIKQGRAEAALKIIRDLKLYDINKSDNIFDVPTIILQIIKKGAIRDALMYLKVFKLKDDNDLDNKICPTFTEPLIVKALLQSLDWSFALSYIEKSKFKTSLEQMFPKRSMLKLMIRRKDWSALSTFLKKEPFQEVLKDKEGEAPNEFKKVLVNTLLEDQEVAKAAKYALKFKLTDSYPMKSLFEKLIRRHEFGTLKKLLKKYELEEDINDLQQEIQITKILALKHFRRRYNITPMPQKQVDPKAVVVDKLPFQSVELKVKQQLAPFQDDKFLVETEDNFFRFLKDSNSNIELCQNATEPFAPRVSPRLQQFVERKLQASQNQKRGFNAQAEEWRPPAESLSRQYSRSSIQKSPVPFPMLRRQNTMGERLSEKLHRAMGSNTGSNMGAPPGLNFPRHTAEEFVPGGGMLQRQQSMQEFSRQNSLSQNSLRMSSPQMSNSVDAYEMRSRRQDIQRQREMEQLRMRAEMEDLKYREKVEQLIAGLLNLNKEAQEVQRELSKLSMRFKIASRDNNEYEKAFIQKEYQRLRLIKENHKAKERRVLEAANTDSCVREAVSEFQRRRKAMARNQGMPQMSSHSEHQARQRLRLRQHEMEKQRQMQQLRHQQEQQMLQRQQQQRMNQRMSPNFYRNSQNGSDMRLSSSHLDQMNSSFYRAESFNTGSASNGLASGVDPYISQQSFSQHGSNKPETDFFSKFSATGQKQQPKDEDFGFDFADLTLQSSASTEHAGVAPGFEDFSSLNTAGLMNSSSAFDLDDKNLRLNESQM